jgi:hypothetical protein
MPEKSFSEEVSKMLGPWYGGPVLSYENGKFILQTWGDAPVCNEVIATGETIPDLIRNYRKRKKR